MQMRSEKLKSDRGQGGDADHKETEKPDRKFFNATQTGVKGATPVLVACSSVQVLFRKSLPFLNAAVLTLSYNPDGATA